MASSGLRMPRMSRANTPTVSAGNFRPMAYSPGTRDLILRWPEHELATPVPFWRPDTETLVTGQHQEETAIWWTLHNKPILLQGGFDLPGIHRALLLVDLKVEVINQRSLLDSFFDFSKPTEKKTQSRPSGQWSCRGKHIKNVPWLLCSCSSLPFCF